MTKPIAVLVDGSPKVATLALNRNDNLVKEPAIAARSETSLNTPRVLGPERTTPLTNGLVGDSDPAFGQEIFDIAKAQGEPVIKPHRLRDDFGWDPDIHGNLRW